MSQKCHQFVTGCHESVTGVSQDVTNLSQICHGMSRCRHRPVTGCHKSVHGSVTGCLHGYVTGCRSASAPTHRRPAATASGPPTPLLDSILDVVGAVEVPDRGVLPHAAPKPPASSAAVCCQPLSPLLSILLCSPHGCHAQSVLAAAPPHLHLLILSC